MPPVTDIAILVFNGVSWGMATFLVAAGLTLIFGVLHILNFAHGGFFMVGAYVACSLLRIAGAESSLPVYLLAALGAGFVVSVLGLATDLAIFRRLRGVDDAYVLIATYALLLVLDGAVKLIWGLSYYSVSPPDVLAAAAVVGDLVMPYYTLFVIGCGVAAFLALEWLLHGTSFGTLIQAVAMDAWMARLLGINVTFVFSITMIIGFALAGLAGGLLVANQSLSPELASVFIIQAFGVVIVGGMGSIRGAFLAAIVLGIVESLGSMLASDYPGIPFFAAMAGILLLRPQGLLGRERPA